MVDRIVKDGPLTMDKMLERSLIETAPNKMRRKAPIVVGMVSLRPNGFHIIIRMVRKNITIVRGTNDSNI